MIVPTHLFCDIAIRIPKQALRGCSCNHSYVPSCARARRRSVNLTQAREVIVKMKVFSLRSGNRKPDFDTLRADVNAWLADHPDIAIEYTHELGQPNVSWSHLALAVWYKET
jgi:hypothetical protein